MSSGVARMHEDEDDRETRAKLDAASMIRETPLDEFVRRLKELEKEINAVASKLSIGYGVEVSYDVREVRQFGCQAEYQAIEAKASQRLI